MECTRNLPLCTGGDLCVALVSLRDAGVSGKNVIVNQLQTIKIGNSKRMEQLSINIHPHTPENLVTFICVCIVPNEKLRKLPMEFSPSKTNPLVAATPLNTNNSEYLERLLNGLISTSSESNVRHFTHLGMLDLINRSNRAAAIKSSNSNISALISKMQPYLLSSKGSCGLKLFPVRHLEQSSLSSTQLSSFLQETVITFDISAAPVKKRIVSRVTRCNSMQVNYSKYLLSMCNRRLKKIVADTAPDASNGGNNMEAHALTTSSSNTPSAGELTAKQKQLSMVTEVFHHYYYTAVLLSTDTGGNAAQPVTSKIERCNSYSCPFCKSFTACPRKSPLPVDRDRMAYRLCAHIVLNHSAPYFRVAFSLDEYNCLHVMYFPAGVEGKLSEACMPPPPPCSGPPKVYECDWISITNKPVIKYNRVWRKNVTEAAESSVWSGFYHMNTTVPMTTSQTVSFLKHGFSVYNVAPCCKEHYRVLGDGSVVTNPLCYNCVRPSPILFNNYSSIDEYSDVSMEEKLFMKLWNHNLYLTSCTNIKNKPSLSWEAAISVANTKNRAAVANDTTPVTIPSPVAIPPDCVLVTSNPYDDNFNTFTAYGDCYMGLVCQNFLIMYKHILVKNELRQVLLVHLLYLFDNNLILSKDIVQYMQYFDSV